MKCNTLGSKTVSADAGNALVTTLGMALCAAVIATTLQTLVMFQAETLRLYDASRQAYWLGRGAALSVLSMLEMDATAVPSTKSVQTAGGNVKESVTFGATDSVRIEASVAGVVNVVVYSYNPTTKKVTAWQDNSP